jgi:hypothetical protein
MNPNNSEETTQGNIEFGTLEHLDFGFVSHFDIRISDLCVVIAHLRIHSRGRGSPYSLTKDQGSNISSGIPSMKRESLE